MSQAETGAGAGSLSVIVCTHDDRRWDSLLRAVESLRTQTRSVDEIIVVVDNNPVLLERVRSNLEDVVAVENRRSAGLSAARNAGVEVARGALLAFLDDDASAAPDWIERLVRACAKPDVLGAGGRVVPRWLAGRPAWFPDEFLWVVGCTYKGVPTRPARVRNLYGGCFCIRREVLDRTGGFRTELGRVGANRMGCEETELCIRAARQWPGRSFRYEPDAVIEHEVTGERARWSYFRSRCFAEGVSKARLARVVGPGPGLSTERSYVARTLPSGIVRHVTSSVARFEPAGITRAGAIAAGLAITAAGYASESARLRALRDRPETG
jgi:glucosyl-dolichyl phosphate glucuronosyltransferase